MSYSNQKNIVSQNDFDRIVTLAQTLIQEGNPVELLLFLKLLSEFVFFDTKEIFFNVLTELCELKPELNQFFSHFHGGKEGPDLTPLAINCIFEFFEKEYHYPSRLLNCQPLSKLPMLVEQIINSDVTDLMRGWVIFNDKEQDPHVVPVSVLKTGGKTHLFILDSLGHFIAKNSNMGDLNRFSKSLESLIAHFKDKDVSEKLAIYSYKIKRQNSNHGCATFSILDVKNFIEQYLHGANIVDFFAHQTNEHLPRPVLENSGFPVFELNILPPEMMKVTQSVKAIGNYENDLPVLESIPSFQRLSFSGDLYDEAQDFPFFHKSVSEILRLGPEETIKNLYVDQKRLCFIVFLIGQFFMKESSTPKFSCARTLFPGDDSDDEKKDNSISTSS